MDSNKGPRDVHVPEGRVSVVGQGNNPIKDGLFPKRNVVEPEKGYLRCRVRVIHDSDTRLSFSYQLFKLRRINSET
jgi:hypothetical protein